MIDLAGQRGKLLQSSGHLLVMGGPGSGKTTIALLKASHVLEKEHILLPGQRILFLSFARATIARVAEQAGKFLNALERGSLEVNTYHGFAWNLLRSHGYLLRAGSPIRLMPPADAAARLSHVARDQRSTEKCRLFEEEGLLHFDLFAAYAADLLSQSHSLANVYSDAYPIILLDEFQDTNADEWRLIQVLGARSRLIALADPDQRIYEFRGADPRRIAEFTVAFSPTPFDLGTENHRSNGTDIVDYGNDLLSGANRGRTYQNVKPCVYGYYQGRKIHFPLKATLLKRVKALRASVNDWSLAVLVPSKTLMLAVSDYVSSSLDSLPEVSHDVALETEGPALAAALIAGLLEGDGSPRQLADFLLRDLCVYIRGCRGNEPPTQADLTLVMALEEYLTSKKVRGKNRQKIIAEAGRIAVERCNMTLTGDPSEDWLAVRRILESSSADEFKAVGENARYLRLLHKGAALRARLGEIWRDRGSYNGAPAAITSALLQEHFAVAAKTWHGIHLMTMHKAKGKEFDEVIIYEGVYTGRIVRDGASEQDIAQARLALRVAVTRAKRRVTILTPKSAPCPFV